MSHNARDSLRDNQEENTAAKVKSIGYALFGDYATYKQVCNPQQGREICGGVDGVEGASPSPFCSAALAFSQGIFLQEVHTKNTNVAYLKIASVPIAEKLFQEKKLCSNFILAFFMSVL